MSLLYLYLLLLTAITLTLTSPQYVDPYVTPLPQFSQLNTGTQYTGTGQGVRIWPWITGQYYTQQYGTTNNNNPYGGNAFGFYNPYNTYSGYNSNTVYNPYGLNGGAGTTFWNGYAWVNTKK